MTPTTNINDNLVKIDNLVTSLSYIYEEIETRKKELIKPENLKDAINESAREIMYTHRFYQMMSRHFRDEYWWNLLSDFRSDLTQLVEASVNRNLKGLIRKEFEELGYTQQEPNENW